MWHIPSSWTDGENKAEKMKRVGVSLVWLTGKENINIKKIDPKGFSRPGNNLNFNWIYYFYTSLFFGFYIENRGQNEKIWTDLKKCTQSWFAGLRVFPGLVFFFFFISYLIVLNNSPTCLKSSESAVMSTCVDEH